MTPNKPLSPRERAEKIIARWRPHMKLFGPSEGFPMDNIPMLDYIIIQIEEAILDDREKRTADDLYKLSRKSGFKQGFTAAREKAKGILMENYPEEYDAMDGYKAISAMEPPHGE